VDKSEKRMDIKAILEEGLKKANATVSSGSSISTSHAHSFSSSYNKKGRYEDRRKEMKLREIWKKDKKIDLKKVNRKFY
jgi:hypothetical protein